MTQEQQDAAWRSFTEEVKEEVCCDYSNALQAHSSDPNNPRIDAHIKFLEEYFGKHNLTATAQEPPLKATAAESLIQMAKDEMGVANNDTPKSGTPNWLAYRMELAKEVVKEAMRFEGISNSERVAYHTMAIVDGIVERLKGGVSQ